jgi:4-amino-4-deoxy-L-arabinose transferase-like glycosyltransferase
MDSEGKGFSNYREPGYPLFLSLIYKTFGVENFKAVKMVQMVLLAITAFIVFKIFKLYNFTRTGVITGSAFALLPLYAYQVNLLQSELWTIFLLISSFFIILKILEKEGDISHYILLGIVFALLGLTRVHTLLMPLIFAGIFYWKNKPSRHIITSIAIVFITVLLWATYVYSNIGTFAITEGRGELHLYTRSIRATFPYNQQIHYFVSWIKRSALHGASNEILEKYDPILYGALVNGVRTEDELREESIARIKQNLGRYLFGNPIEIAKMMFVEHLFPPVSPLLNRTVRLMIYLVIYLIFIIGVVSSFMFSKNKQFYTLINVGLIYIAYHWVVLSFFDVIPRFNTPYLGLYLIMGMAGIVNQIENIKHKV